MRFKHFAGVTFASVTMIGVLAGCGSSASAKKPTSITIATQDFSEPVIDDYMVKDIIEANTPVKVSIKQTSGGSGLMHSMMQKNDIQIYTGWDGTEFAGSLKQSYTGAYKGHPNKVYNYVKTQEMKQFSFWTSPSLGYEDTYALTVTQATADKYHLKTVSDALPYAKNWVLGTDTTFQSRKGDGLDVFEKTYGIKFKSAKAMSYDLMYPALANNGIQAGVAYSTDGRLKKLHEVGLTDDKHFFPPYHAVLLIRSDVEKAWNLNQVLKPLFGLVTTADQTELNYEVDVLKKDPSQVAHDFLVKKGVLKK